MAFFQTNRVFETHQRKTGHKQISSTIGERSEKIELTDDLAQLQDSLKQKDTSIAQLNDSMKAKNELIARLEDSIRTKDAEFAGVHNEVAQLSSLEHEQDIVRNTLKNLNKEAYDLIGQKLGFIPVSLADGLEPQPATQDGAEAARDTHNVEVVSSNLTPATNSAVVEDNKPKEEPGIFIGKKTEPGWKYFEGLGFSVRQD